MSDPFAGQSPGLSSPVRGGYDVTPHDTVDFAIPFRVLRASGAGNIVIVLLNGYTFTRAFTAGEEVSIYHGKRVNQTNTTATGIQAFY